MDHQPYRDDVYVCAGAFTEHQARLLEAALKGGVSIDVLQAAFRLKAA